MINILSEDVRGNKITIDLTINNSKDIVIFIGVFIPV